MAFEDGCVEATIENNGEMDGDEIAFVFSHTESTDSPPNPSLVGFTREGIKKGEEKRMRIPLSPEAFTLVNEEGVRYKKKGLWTLSVGGGNPKSGKNIEIKVEIK